MSVHRRVRNGTAPLPIAAGHPYFSLEKWRVSGPTRRAFGVLTALSLLAYAPCKADVPAPPTPPSVPGDYCSSLYTELQGDLQAFHTQLTTTTPGWTPVSLGPTLNTVALAWANSDTGPQISSPNYLQTVLAQLQEVKALGVQGVSIPILFPVLYAPFYGAGSAGETALQPYLTFYESVAQAVRAAGLKLIVDDEIAFSNDIQAGWTNMNAFYSTLSWPEYMAARATMAATIAQYIQPDYLSVANEPDTEAVQTGQTNLNIPADAAQMVAGEIVAVQALNLPNPPKLGAGFGTWFAVRGPASLQNYINAYVALPLDYIDFHVIPVNTVGTDNFLQNALTIASAAAGAGKAVAIGQAWLGKAAASELAGGYSISNIDMQRARQPFSFWQPLDAYYMHVMENLASYTQMAYLDLYQTFFLNAYQTYGGTVDNGGSTNCTCTTASCSDYQIMQTESTLANDADQASVYTAFAFDYHNQLVRRTDTTPPTLPTNPTGTPGYTTAILSWNASSDNIGVAGYNVYRCTPPAAGQSCTGVWVANATLTSFNDTSLTSNTPYNYQVQAFDFAGNNSALSETLSLVTYRTAADAATNLVATAISAQEIDLSWSPPVNPTGLSQYLVFGGTSAANLQQIAVRSAGTTTYKYLNLAPGTTYYYGIVAVEEGIDAAMSNIAFATTLPLPSPPSDVAGTPAPTQAVLTWQEVPEPNGLPISFYKIFEGATPGNMTNTGSAIAATYTATSLAPSTTYYFEIVAVDTDHEDSAPSNQIAVTTLPMPAAPVNVGAKANSTSVRLTWSENIPPNGLPILLYNVLRGTSPSGLTQLTTRTAPPYLDTGVSPDATYYYAIEAVDTGHDVSPMSATAQTTTPAVPAAPVDVAATATSATHVTVTWSENVPPEGQPVQNYYIYRGTSPTGMAQLASRAGSPFIDTSASPATQYYYAIEAVDTSQDVSPLSATAEADTPAAPAAPVSVVATANSGTKVTVTWSEGIPTNGLPVQNYYIYRGASPTGIVQVASRTAPPFIDTGVSGATTYYYAIEAVDTGQDVSPMSAAAQVTTP